MGLSSTLSPVFMDNLRQLVSSFISNCFHCNKVQARGGRFRPFSHVLTDPWVSVKMKEFNASSTFFSRISLDNLTVKVRRTRTRKSDDAYLSLLFGVDCCTGYFFCLPMNDLSSKSLISSLQVLFIKYSQPKEIITDAHSTFVSLASNNPWPGCNIRPRAGGEQFSNFVESSIRVETLLNNNLYSSDLLLYSE